MINDIATKQNDQRHINQLMAATMLYESAAKWHSVQFVLSAMNAFFLLVLVVLPEWKVWSGFITLLVIVVDLLVIEVVQKSLRRRAAGIQELFDCEVLGMEWNTIKVGQMPTDELIQEKSAAYKRAKRNHSGLCDWYSVGDSRLPLEVARILCQRANCRWDSKLRLYYANALLSLFFVVLVVLLAAGLLTSHTLESFLLSVVSPLLPMCLWLIKEYTGHKETGRRKHVLYQMVESLWGEALEGRIKAKDLSSKSRALQDEIYDSRRNGLSVPNYLYKKMRKYFQESMETTVEECSRQYLNKP